MESLNMNSLNKYMNKSEYLLSKAASAPIIGTVAGLTKQLMGIAQTTMGLAIGIIAGIPLSCSGDSTCLKHSWSIVKRGLGNVAYGIAEAMPGVGTLMWISITSKQSKNVTFDSNVNTDDRNTTKTIKKSNTNRPLEELELKNEINYTEFKSAAETEFYKLAIAKNCTPLLAEALSQAFSNELDKQIQVHNEDLSPGYYEDDTEKPKYKIVDSETLKEAVWNESKKVETCKITREDFEIQTGAEKEKTTPAPGKMPHRVRQAPEFNDLIAPYLQKDKLKQRMEHQKSSIEKGRDVESNQAKLQRDILEYVEITNQLSNRDEEFEFTYTKVKPENQETGKEIIDEFFNNQNIQAIIAKLVKFN